MSEPIEALPSKVKQRSGIKLQTIRSMALALAFLIVGVGIGYQWNSLQAGGLFPPFSQPVKLERNQLDFSQFWAVWDKLEASYVDPDQIDHQQMIEGAIEGMTAAVGDPYTVYLPPQENQTSKEDLNGEFDGVGIQLGYKMGTVAVQTPLENHPAIKEGVKAGDLILHIKDESREIDTDTSGMTLQEAVKLIRGKRGTPVTLTFYREEKGTFEKTIIRDRIVQPSVELVRGDLNNGVWEKNPQGQVAWMRVYRFGDNTEEQWDAAVAEVLRDQDQIKGIVMDLRNNPGGYLQSAVNLASDFIPEGLVVTQQGKNRSEEYTVSRRARLLNEPLVVLINGGSASASEILAGALRDRLGVSLVGEKSFGKGTVQSVEDFQSGAGLHVTVAKWLLPGGDWIHDKGLVPAVEVVLPEDATESAETRDTQLEKAVEVLTGAS